MRCLRVDPAGRFANVTELALALAPFAPPAGRLVSERILAVTRATRPAIAEASITASNVEVAVASATARSTTTEAPPFRYHLVIAGGALLLFAVIAVGGLTLRRHKVDRPATLAQTASTGALPDPMASASLLPSAHVTTSPDSATTPSGSPPVESPVTSKGAMPTHTGQATTGGDGLTGSKVKPAEVARPPSSAGQRPRKDDPFQSRTSF
jgi:hypothetical protein